MLIPLGILAGSGGVADSYELIESVILGTATSSVTFSSLATYASTYKHLQLRFTARSDEAANVYRSVNLRLNGNTTANYHNHRLRGSGGTVNSGASLSQTFMTLTGRLAANNVTSGVFGATIIDILDAFSASKNTTVRTLAGIEAATAAGEIFLGSSFLNDTASITSITLLPDTAVNFLAGSRFSLYGIRG